MEYSGFSLCEAPADRPHAETLNHLLRQVETADVGGMEGWFFAEHHSNAAYSLTPSPNLLLAAAGARTARIRLGTMVTVLPYHHPLRVAEEIRLLDALTGGRLEVGLARGGIPYEQAAFGMEDADNEGMLAVGLELLLRLLTEESVDYDTVYWRGKGATAVPQATQTPHPPMWLAAVSDHSFQMAARFGMGCETSLSYPELLKAQMEIYGEAWNRHHPEKRRGRFGVLLYTVVAETERDAIQYGKRFVQQKIDGFLGGFGNPRPGTKHRPAAKSRRRLFDHISKLSFDQMIEESLIVFGSVEQCVEQVARLRSTGIDMLTYWLQFAGLDFDFADRSLTLLCEEVIPRVERAATGAGVEPRGL